MALFRVDFSGRGELSERQQKVKLHGHVKYANRIQTILEACTGLCNCPLESVMAPIGICLDALEIDKTL
jgi:hypothetical protein